MEVEKPLASQPTTEHDIGVCLCSVQVCVQTGFAQVTMASAPTLMAHAGRIQCNA